MFVAINNTDMDINDVDKWIKVTRDANGGVISPEFAMEILGKTNHLGHIKKVLKNIKDNCKTAEELKPYHEFFLSCLDGREMSPNALKMIFEMGKSCTNILRLEYINSLPKIYGLQDNQGVTVKTIAEFEALEGNGLKVFCDCDYLPYNYDFSDFDMIKFKEGADVSFYRSKNLPEVLDLSMCSKVYFENCDLTGVKVIKFGKGSDVTLISVKKLPEILDVSMCSNVLFGSSDLSLVKEVRFRTKKQKVKKTNFNKELLHFNGEIIYTDVEKNNSNILTTNGGMGV